MRSVLLAGQQLSDGRRAVVQIKSNLGPLAAPIEFTLSDAGLTWLGEAMDLTADALMAGPGRDSVKLTAAIEWLAAFLADGPVEQSIVKKEGEKAGHTWRTLRRAADELGVDKVQQIDALGHKGPSLWFLAQ